MIPHSNQVAGRFSAAASTYEQAALLQREIARRVVALVPSCAQARTILDAGCGTGGLTVMARERWPAARITGVDIAAGMINEVTRKFAQDPLFARQMADLMTYTPESRFDLVVSGSVLHWLRPFERGFMRTACLVEPGGYLAAALMLDGTLGEVQAARREVAPHKEPVFRLPSRDELEQVVQRLEGFRCLVLESTVMEHHYASAREALRGFHAAGVTGGAIARAAAPLTRRELQALEDCYERNGRSPAGVRATYATGYVLVQRIA